MSAATPARRARSRTMRAVSSIPIFCADTVGCLTSALSSSTYSATRARTCSSKRANAVTPARVSLGGDRRRTGLALPQLAARREWCHLDPALLAEVVHDTIEIFDRLAPVHLRARDHVDAVAAVLRERGTRTIRDAGDGEREGEARERENDDDENDGEDSERPHIRERLPSVREGTGGDAMSSLRVVVLVVVLA